MANTYRLSPFDPRFLGPDILTLPKQRQPEPNGIADEAEATRYIEATSYDENSDYLLFAKEIDQRIGLSGKNVLELCSGSGDLGRRLIEAGAATVVGFDGSPTMVGHAQERFSRPGLRFVQGDVFQVTKLLPRESFDLVVCQNSLHHFAETDVLRFITTACSMLKQDGFVYLADFDRGALTRSQLVGAILTERLRQAHPSVAGDLRNSLFAAFSQTELEHLLRPLAAEHQVEIYSPIDDLRTLTRDPGFWKLIGKDPHPHHLDYGLSLRICIQKSPPRHSGPECGE